MKELGGLWAREFLRYIFLFNLFSYCYAFPSKERNHNKGKEALMGYVKFSYEVVEININRNPGNPENIIRKIIGKVKTETAP